MMSRVKLIRVFILLGANVLGILILLYLLQFNWVTYYYDRVRSWLPGLAGSGTVVTATDNAQQLRELELLEREELEKVREGFLLRETELTLEEQRLSAVAAQLASERAELVMEREELLASNEQAEALAAALRSYEVKVSDLADRFYNMPPASAAARILALGDDVLIIDVLAEMDQVAENNEQLSVVPFLLSLMPPEDAARIMKKSTVTLQ